MVFKKPIFIVLTAIVSLFAAESYFWGNVRMDGGGFVSAVLAHPKEEGLFYARTDVGGVYRWDNAKQVWLPLMDFISQDDVGLYGTESVAIDPNNPERLYIMAGTSYFSDGKTVVFRSMNYGLTFDTVDVTRLWKAHGNGMGRQTGEKLVVDPQNPNVLFCGSRQDGLFKSTDAGKTWSNVSTIGASADADLLSSNGISFIVFDPTSALTANGSTSIIYMGVSATSSNFYKSTNGGASWTLVSGGPANQMPHRAVFSHGSLFITFSNATGPHNISSGAFYKYQPTSTTWTNLTPKEEGVYLGSGGQSYSHGFGGVSVDPKDANHIIISTLNYYGGQSRYANGAEGWGDRIYVTKDGGANWSTPFAPNYPVGASNANVASKDNLWIAGHAIHWAGCVVFNPFNTNEAWVTSGNGVFRSLNVNDTKPIWSFDARGIEETVPLDIVSVPGGPLVTAIGDYDGAAYQDISNSTLLHNPRIGTTYSLGYAPHIGAFLRTGHVTDYSSGSGIESNVMYYSKDLAKTWTKTPTPVGAHGLVVLSADGASWLHRPENSNTVYYSHNQGVSWNDVAGLDAQSQYSKIVADPINPSVFYALDQQGNLRRSNDKGKNFAKVGSVQNESLNLWQASNGLIRTVPGKEGYLWAPLDQAQSWATNGKYSTNGLARSTDGGVTWARIPAVYSAHAVGVGKAAVGVSHETLFIWGVAGSSSNSLGIYRSTDLGDTWVRINDDAHQYGGPGNGNFVQGDMNVFGRVYMSTAGRGLVYGDLNESTPIKAPSSLNKKGLGSLSLHEFELRIETAVPAQLLFFNLKGKLLHAQSVNVGSSVSLEPWKGSGILFARLISNSGKVLSQKKIELP